MQSLVPFLFRRENKSFIAPAKPHSHSSRADCVCLVGRGVPLPSTAGISSVASGHYQCHVEACGSVAGKAGLDKPFRLLLELLASVPVGGRGATCFQDSIVRDWPEVSVDKRKYQDCTREKEFCLHRSLLA